MRIILVIIAFGVWSSIFPTYADTLHAILVSTSSLDGTGSIDISPGAEASLHSVDALLSDIAAHSGMSYSKHVISGDSFISVRVNQEIDMLEAESEDVIVFFYAGHGVHSPRDRNLFPSMFIPTSHIGEIGAIQQVFVKDRLKAKGAHLLIVIFDSCNSLTTGFPVNPNFANYPSLPDTSNVRSSLRSLFSASGTILIASAKVGTRAWIVNETGGVFTRQLLGVLNQKIRAGSLRWDTLVKAAASPIQVGSEDQSPIYNVEVRP